MTPERIGELGHFVPKLSQIFGPHGVSHDEMLLVLAWYVATELGRYDEREFNHALASLVGAAMFERSLAKQGKSPFVGLTKEAIN